MFQLHIFSCSDVRFTKVHIYSCIDVFRHTLTGWTNSKNSEQHLISKRLTRRKMYESPRNRSMQMYTCYWFRIRRACCDFDCIWWTLSSYYLLNLMQPKSVSLMIYISTNLVIYHPSFLVQVSWLNKAMYCVQYCNSRWCAFGSIDLGL
jgi:hypothetical protein